MRIDRIALYNFGSYEGETEFDTNSASGRNIVLIGGKNGAGKTTLFTAMRVCLYGYMSMGYKNQGAYYFRAIKKLINNQAKRSKPAAAHVEMQISLSNGHGLDQYLLRRSWVLNDSVEENFSLKKNGITLSAEEIADFEKYLLSLIPPELFNLYFFDGEKIADFFMEEGGNARIKDAFLTLCGYDTFEIMRRNFKRISSSLNASSTALDEYLEAKQAVTTAQEAYQAALSAQVECSDAFDACEAELLAIEKDYSKSGGITQDEWNQKLFALKEEEKKREKWNALLKKWANDLVPFLMVSPQILAIKEQISKENDAQKVHNFCEILETPEIQSILGANSESLKRIALEKYGNNSPQILALSLEQTSVVLTQVNRVLSFDVSKIAKCKAAIKNSLALTVKLREELEKSNVSYVQEYMNKKDALLDKKAQLLNQRAECELQVIRTQESLQQAEVILARAQTKLEAELKNTSIKNISANAIVMLDKLQKILYRQQIEKVKAFFKEEVNRLMRKTNFIDDIEIDDDFSIRLYRYDFIDTDVLANAIMNNTEEQLIALFGEAALNTLKTQAESSVPLVLVQYCNSYPKKTIPLPVEIDKTSFSNGEKQIFIMALYHSLIQLGRHEIPFIIDTPFARIDTEHRHNIAKYFFNELNGQVFILSTNEEISTSHVAIMKERIAATYILENSDNKKTVAVRNSYFEEV